MEPVIGGLCPPMRVDIPPSRINVAFLNNYHYPGIVWPASFLSQLKNGFWVRGGGGEGEGYYRYQRVGKVVITVCKSES